MKNIRLLIFILAILKFILPFVLQNGHYQPHRDEFLYLDQGNHLDWGYVENPPIISFFGYLTRLLGNEMVWIKFWPSLFGALTFYLTAEIVLSFGGASFAIFLLFLSFVVTGFLRIQFLLQPSFLDIFFCTAMALTLIKYVQSEKPYWLYLFGISVGLGIMSKYSAGFYFAALMAGLLFSKQAKVYLNFHLYLALIIAAIIVAPNIYWQYQHNFPIVNQMKEMQDVQGQSMTAGKFITDQFMLLLPVFYLWIMGILYIVLLKKGLTSYSFLLTAFVLEIIYLLVTHGKGYYALNAYPPLLAIGAYNFARLTKKYVKILRYALITFSAFFGLFVAGMSIPVLPPDALAEIYESRNVINTGVLQWDDQQNHSLPQDFADMLGWKEITDRTLRVYSSFTEDIKAHTLIIADNSGIAGALNYFGKSQGLPMAYCYTGSYALWMPDNMEVKNIILISPQAGASNDDVYKHFKVADQMDDITIPYARESGLKITLYAVPDGQQNDALKDAVAIKKQAYTQKQNAYQ